MSSAVIFSGWRVRSSMDVSCIVRGRRAPASFVAVIAVSQAGYRVPSTGASAHKAADFRALKGRCLSHLLPPQPRRGDVGALAQRAQLQPHHRLYYPFAIGEGAEAAVRRGDDAFAIADDRDGLLDAPRHNLRVLDNIARRLDHPG